MIGFDNNKAIEVLDHILREQEGWRPLGGLFRRNRNNPQIYARNGRHVVLFGPIRVSPESLLDPNHLPSLQDEFEVYLEKIREELEKHIDALQPKDLTIVFTKGGALQVPDWFMDWCKQNGIRVRFTPDPERDSHCLHFVLEMRRLLEEIGCFEFQRHGDGYPGMLDDRCPLKNE
jgi:hypothetical protein